LSPRYFALALLSGVACIATAWHIVPRFPKASSTSDARVALGRMLFFDSALSADGKTSCASCHQPRHAYSDGRATAVGAFGRQGTRNTPSLLTTGNNRPLFWDGRRHLLSEAVLDPLLHPAELALANEEEILSHIQTPAYRAAFAAAFGTTDRAPPTIDRVGLALVDFIQSLPRPITAFDRYQATHDDHTLSPESLDGLRLFIGKAGCSQCHKLDGTPSGFSDDSYHSTGTGLQSVASEIPSLSQRISAEPTDITAIGKEVGTHANVAALGRFVVTHRPRDIGLFRTPSLRYVANTPPYMHDGTVSTLEAAVDQEIYWRGLASGQPLSLTVPERAHLIVFLYALSAKTDQPTEQRSANTRSTSQ